MSWLSGWAKRVKLTIDETDIDASLTDFPILLYLSTSSGRNADNLSFVFSEIQSDANRRKIAVTTSDGTTQCHVEIERWDNANQRAWLHVKVPSVSATVDTDLYLYFDRNQPDNTTYVGDTNTNVWNSDFFAVWHMREASGNIFDSTSNGNTLTAGGTPIYGVDAWVGKGIEFEKDNSATATRATFNPASSNYTVEFWLKPESLYNYNELIKANGWSGFNCHTAANGILYIGTGATARIETETGYLVAGVAYYLALSRETDVGQKLYKNGALTHSNANFPTPTWAGWDISPATNYADSIFDEVRFSKTIRSAAWIKATYETLRDHLLDWGSEEIAFTPFRRDYPHILAH